MSSVLAPPELAVTTIRTLAIDAVERANSGHPGAPMGLAAVGWALFTGPLRHSPANPLWPDRDRFVLSNGHASMLLYALLHLTGYDLALEDLERFRQWDSRTPGHPEYGITPGVEITTGPLGQGFANSVGFALAERMLAARYNRPGHDVVDHRTWFICSDGDLMEGISHEAASLAGFLRLGRLVGIYDDNAISLDGPTSLSFAEDVPARFRAYGWRVLTIEDANDLDEIGRVLQEAQRPEPDGVERPTLIDCHSHIGFGSPNKQDSSASHGAALGKEEVALTKRSYGWPEDAQFLVPPEVAVWREEMAERGRALEREWEERMESYAAEHPHLAAEFVRVVGGELPVGWDGDLPRFSAADEKGGKLATRVASARAINALAPRLPELVGGAADLASSTNTTIKDGGDVSPGSFAGRNLHFGVREHAMGAVTNGLAVHGGFRPFGATFLQFSDYMKNTIRLAALMEAPSIFVYTHDSVALGEDGPTHQPVEHLAGLRAIPNLVTIRPADANETAAAWREAVARRDGPTVIVLTRQGLPILDGPADVARGAYVLAEGEDCILIGTGSEVSVALDARELLAGEGIAARVVSMPSFELFAAQDEAYRRSVLPPGRRARVGVEAASPFGWERWTGGGGEIVAIDRFGASAPGEEVLARLGITAEAVAEAARAVPRRNPVTLRASLGTGARAVRDAWEGAAATGLAGRVRAGDPSAFGPHAGAARDWLGWLRAPVQGRGHVADIEALLRELRMEGVRHVVVLGMGGSSLSPEVTRRTFGHRAGIELRVLDSTDPAAVSAAGAGVDPERALYLVSSKSGTTVETLAFLAHFWAQAEGALGAGRAGSRFLAITDPGTPLVDEAAARGFRAVAESPADVGGRYSALSLFGLVPMGLAGVPLQPLLDRAQAALASDDGPRLGIALAALAEAGRDKVTLVCDPPIAAFGLWVEQLLAESLGKEGRGLVPVEGEPLDGVEAYGEDRLFVYHRMTGEHDADLADAAAEGHPVLALDVLEPLELGGLYLTWQLATACAGALLGVNPFDQPDVQAAKAATDAALAEILAGEGPDEPLAPPEALAGWVDAAAPGDYLALQAFLPPSPAVDRALAAIRTAARARRGVATTAGYGPRYLHSTGQLHKGGPPTGRLVQLVAEHEADLGVPGRPFTFGQLERAQALGDARVLAERGRGPLRIGLGGDARAGLAAALRSLA